MKRFQFLSLMLLATLPFASRTSAQNVAGYGMISDPFLFLLREPAVHADLGLRAEQKQRLIEINESFDGILLATRNLPWEEGQKRIAEVMTKTREQVSRLFSSEQQTRMRQIAYRLRGLSFVLLPHAAEQLGLSDQQKQHIQAIVAATLERIGEVQTKTFPGEEAQQKAQRDVAVARKQEQETILETLDDKQKQRLLALVGRRFDPTTLGQVSFKAPELSDGDQWINSDALKLKDLRGKVVALHFWAFG